MEKETSQFANSIDPRILIEPWITEASTRAAELNKYVFRIDSRATKADVVKVVEKIYKVKVISVNTTSIPRKKRVRGRSVGWKKGYKKALVTLKEGDRIEFFEGK